MSDENTNSGWGLQGTLGGTTDENDNPYSLPDKQSLDPNFVPHHSSGGGYNYNSDYSNPASPQPEQPAWEGSQFTDTQLKDMFKNEPGWRTPQSMGGLLPQESLSNGLTQANWGHSNDGTPNQNDPNAGSVNWFQPGSLPYKLGMRNPGSPAAQDFFNHETAPERDVRSDLVGRGIEGIAKSMLPAPVSMGMHAYNAYQNYQNDPSKGLGSAIANALSGASGYTGALANMYNGNYGSAAMSALGKNGISGPGTSAAGIGIDYLTGKNIAPSLGGFTGQVLGNAAGGTLGGMFGKQLGQFMSKDNVVRK
jgi:hypothetical protein